MELYRKQFSIATADEEIIKVLEERSSSKLRNQFLENLLTAYAYNVEIRALVDSGGRPVEAPDYVEPGVIDNFADIQNMLMAQQALAEVGLNALKDGLDDVLDVVNEKADMQKETILKKRAEEEEEKKRLAIEKKKLEDEVEAETESEVKPTTENQQNTNITGETLLELFATQFGMSSEQFKNNIKTLLKETETTQTTQKDTAQKQEETVKSEPKNESEVKNTLLNNEQYESSSDSNNDALFNEDVGTVEVNETPVIEPVDGEAKEQIGNFLASLL